MAKISVVINTWNEEKNLPRALASIRTFADEIVVVDMESSDSTREIAKKAGAKVYSHKQTGYVEPARNFALRRAQGEHILILDADEEVPPKLAQKLKGLAENPIADFYRLPRKNLIFGKWIKHSRWWPDYNIRFFKKGAVFWSEIIHSVPETHGVGRDLPDKEELAVVHHEHNSISGYLSRHDRYSTIMAQEKIKEGYKFAWRDLIQKPTGEFLSRFFFGEAYKDGVHGLALSLLQSFTELLIYLKVWEIEKFKGMELDMTDVSKELNNVEMDLDHWLIEKRFRKLTIIRKLLRRVPR